MKYKITMHAVSILGGMEREITLELEKIQKSIFSKFFLKKEFKLWRKLGKIHRMKIAILKLEKETELEKIQFLKTIEEVIR